MEQSDLGGSDIETLLDRLEHVTSIVIRSHEDNVFCLNSVLQLLQRARHILEEVSDERNCMRELPLVFTGNTGRPTYDIPLSQLQYLIENGFTIGDISSIIGVSRRTINRRIQQYGFSLRQCYSQLSDAELDNIVSSILHDFPNCGYRRMDGFLRARGLRVQQKKIRCSVKRLDPDGVLLRSMEINLIKRRSYNVIAPMALWHVDGYHKLIRYA